MLFKKNYEPDAGSDDAPEALAEAAPTSEARQRLAGLIADRSQANAEMQAARSSIAKLTATQSLAAPFEQQRAMLLEQAAQAMRSWSDGEGDEAPPVQDVERLSALERSIVTARGTAEAARLALPSKESEFLRASNKAASITWAVNAEIAAILLEEIKPCLVEIANLKSDLAMRAARAEAGLSHALGLAETIPADRRVAVAASFYTALAALQKTRDAAMSPPAPVYSNGAEWSRLVADLAVSGHQAGEA
jgi:hypothetical protein